METLRGHSLLSLDDLTREGIVEVLDTAETFVEVNQRTIKKVPALKGRVVASGKASELLDNDAVRHLYL